MKKTTTALLLLLLAFCLAACAHTPQPTQPTLPPTEPIITQPPTEAPTVIETTPEHSVFYIPGLDVEDVIVYFSEVCLDAEFAHDGDATKLQKWVDPITYGVMGDPTEADLEVLEGFMDWLNAMDGFPGIERAGNEYQANLRIHFCDQQELLTIMGDSFTGLDGAVTFWYTDNEIYDATICIRTDLDQHLRNSVILEELYNGLGPIQDTDLRSDSIIYSAFSEPQSLTAVDELILKLLYSPELLCGMDAAECADIIRQLYN